MKKTNLIFSKEKFLEDKMDHSFMDALANSLGCELDSRLLWWNFCDKLPVYEGSKGLRCIYHGVEWSISECWCEEVVSNE